MNFKRYVEASDTWVDSHYIKGTDTDIITTLPATIYPLAQTATVGLKGNTTQNGTPTPDNPIMPQGTGERTGNLCDESELVNNKHLSPSTGLPTTIVGRVAINTPIDVSGYTTVTLTFAFKNAEGVASAMYSIFSNGTLISRTTAVLTGAVIDVSNADQLYLAFYLGGQNAPDITTDNIDYIMLNKGSTPLPHEPHGYKIPISSASTITPIYLGEVQTTRKIGKYECTGNETWQIYSSSDGTYGVWQFFANGLVNGTEKASAYSNVAEYGVTSDNRSSHQYGVYLVTSGTGIAFQMAGAKDTFQNLTAWKSYLQQQYAAGTPVTVWYILASETTGIVNEPLMKIGSYADSISGISVTTTAGANTLDVDTTVKPSEVTANFNGWHPVTSAHERSGGAWT